MKYIEFKFLTLFFLINSTYIMANEPVSYLWVLDNLTEIDGVSVSATGNPEVVDTDLGKAIRFDGDGDRILIDANPVEAAKDFTVEVIFKAEAGQLNQNNEPRFIHIQNPDDPIGKRVMMEIRVNEDDKVYLDGFMKTDNDNLALIDETKLHETEVWNHAAITYEGNTFTTYFNGIKELSGEVTYQNEIVDEIGQTSIGARMNKRNWYSGLIKCLKVTQAKLNPEDFIKVEDFLTTEVFTEEEESISIFPMPSNEVFTVRVENNSIYYKAMLFDLRGKLVAKEDIFADEVKISTSELPNGVYLLKLVGDKMHKTINIEVVH